MSVNADSPLSNVSLQDIDQIVNHGDIKTIMSVLPLTEPVAMPLVEYVRSNIASAVRGGSHHRTLSPAASIRSDDSLDSIASLSTTNNPADGASDSVTEESKENNELIYRLCCSLYKRALRHVRSGQRSKKHSSVDADTRHEKNMNQVVDWLPLLHLFEPKMFYAYQNGKSQGQLPGGVQPHADTARTPHEASQKLMDELEVERLSGGNSNFVYRMGSSKFPDRTVLLRVYGGGDSEAIDRYRDVEAMKLMSSAKLSPAVLHTFRWGRVEEFMANVATCTTDMLLEGRGLLSDVYRVASEVHRLPVDNFLPEAVNTKRFHMSATPSIHASPLTEAESSTTTTATNTATNTPTLRTKPTTLSWLLGDAYCEACVPLLAQGLREAGVPYYANCTEAKVLEACCPSMFERATLRYLRMMSSNVQGAYRDHFAQYMCTEVQQVRATLQRCQIPIVFSHNDMNPGNILLAWRKVPPAHRPAGVVVDDSDEVTSVPSEQSNLLSRKFLTTKGHHKNLVELKGVVPIDFEYSDANYRCWDLGNIICEMDIDYSRGTGVGEPGFVKMLYTFPPEAYRQAWKDLPQTYPRMPELVYDTWQQLSGGADEESLNPLGVSILKAVETYFINVDEKAPGATVSREQMTEVLLGMLIAQLHWAMWSFVLGCNSDECTNNADGDDEFAKGSSGLDYVYYGDVRLKEYLQLKRWMQEKQLL